MDDLNQNELEGLLAMLGDGLGVPSPAKEPLEGRIRRLGAAVRAAGAGGGGAQAHLTLADLQAALAARQSSGQEWQMPEHLSACPLCLETFQILLEEGWPGVEPALLEKYVLLRERQLAPAAPARTFRLQRFWPLAAAAAVALAAAVTWRFLAGTTSAGLIDAPGLYNHGELLAVGDKIPDAVLDAQQDTRAKTEDGSIFTIGAKSRLAFHHAHGDTTIDLKFGHLVAQVVHQRQGHKLRVTTPLGEIRVVGTKFSVTSRSEPVIVYQNGGTKAMPKQYNDHVTAVEVAVLEGTVMVKNTLEEVSVTAGRHATLYDQPPRIELAEN